jgi:2-oxoisovalerate dehydrogenase E1 component alpha subunit
MALTRAFDDRMYRGQRQGKTSFYMKCTGEEATSRRRHALSTMTWCSPAIASRAS